MKFTINRDRWVNLQVSGVTSEVPEAKDFKLLEYCLRNVDSDIPITMTGMGMATEDVIKLDLGQLSASRLCSSSPYMKLVTERGYVQKNCAFKRKESQIISAT
jgi:hypothetical protein